LPGFFAYLCRHLKSCGKWNKRRCTQRPILVYVSSQRSGKLQQHNTTSIRGLRL